MGRLLLKPLGELLLRLEDLAHHYRFCRRECPYNRLGWWWWWYVATTTRRTMTKHGATCPSHHLKDLIFH
jgi:hypothetical protein